MISQWRIGDFACDVDAVDGLGYVASLAALPLNNAIGATEADAVRALAEQLGGQATLVRDQSALITVRAIQGLLGLSQDSVPPLLLSEIRRLIDENDHQKRSCCAPPSDVPNHHRGGTRHAGGG